MPKEVGFLFKYPLPSSLVRISSLFISVLGSRLIFYFHRYCGCCARCDTSTKLQIEARRDRRAESSRHNQQGCGNILRDDIYVPYLDFHHVFRDEGKAGWDCARVWLALIIPFDIPAIHAVHGARVSYLTHTEGGIEPYSLLIFSADRGYPV